MAITKLSLYNNALLLLGQRRLTSDTEATETRYKLDVAYDQEAANFCLELIKPRFSLLVVALAAGASPSSNAYAGTHTLPAAYISIHSIFSDSKLDVPITRYLIEGNSLYTDYSTAYVRYVQDGIALSEWSPAFANVVSAYLATKIAPAIAPQKLELLETSFATLVETAQAMEGVKEPQSRSPDQQFTLTTDYLNIYNGALMLLGQEQLTNINDDSKRRAAIDTVINSGAVNYLLELTEPLFATETNVLTASVVSSNHDLDNVFTLPTDYLSMLEVHADPLMDEPINRYLIEGRTIATQYATIYIRFVSSSPAITTWTPGFRQLLSAYIADQIKLGFVDSEVKLQFIAKEYETRLNFVRGNEAQQEANKRPARATATLSNSWRNLYNDALMIIGLTHLVSNDDDSHPRSVMDAILSQGVVATVLEEQGWTFALVSQKVTYDPSLEPTWGYRRVFAMPTDLHRIDGVYQDEYFTTPLADYQQESGLWYCELDDIYIQYVKTSYIENPGAWPQYYRNIVAAEMAVRAAPGLSPQMLPNAREQRRIRNNEGRSTDAMSGPSQMVKRGNWSRSKSGFGRQSRERG